MGVFVSFLVEKFSLGEESSVHFLDTPVQEGLESGHRFLVPALHLQGRRT